KVITAFAAAALLPLSMSSHAATERTLCVFDILGTSGDTYNIMRDYAAAARTQGYDINLRVYTDEGIAAEDLKAGQCDAAGITGVRGRQFNSYTGSMDSIGSIPNYDIMKTVIQVLSSNNPRIVEN